MIRPRPEQILEWAAQSARLRHASEVVDLPPWHFGLVLMVGSPSWDRSPP